MRGDPTRISITVFDSDKKKLFQRETVKIDIGMDQLSEFLKLKLGTNSKKPYKPPYGRTCEVCGRLIVKGTGTTYKGKYIHKRCMTAKYNLQKCAVCGKPIGNKTGTTYKGKPIHKTCIAEAVQWL